MIKKNNHLTKTLFASALIICAALQSAQAGRYYHARESVEVADHRVFGTSERVDGATSLVRNFRHRMIEAHISSNALEPNNAYSIWWAIFNRPQFCITPFECTTADLEISGGDPKVMASVFWAGGFVADGSGSANTSIRLTTGRTGRELFGQTRNYGLQNLTGAEVHVVLRTHGPAGEAGPVAKQIGTANEACPADGCKNVFASIHALGM